MEKPLYLVRMARESALAPRPDSPIVTAQALADTRGRPLRDLRISVTDRCNFRCGYCMPREVFGHRHAFLPQPALLRFEETARLAEVFVVLGVRKIRLTGGEPLLRKNLGRLIELLAALRIPDGEPLDLTLTTNGSLLERQARMLRAAGLRRVTVSLDALDPILFQRLSDSQTEVATVLRGIDAAAEAGLTPVKVNMVVRRGLNDHQILPMAEHFRGSGHILRFIEYMDVGSTNGWQAGEVLSGREILDRLQTHYPLEALPGSYPGEVAERWRYRDGQGEIGVITSISHAFCGDCNRARLSPEGRLFLCLFAHQGYDLRALVRRGAGADEIAGAIRAIWSGRTDAYSEQRGRLATDRPRIEMSYIGG
ncbi:MAG: GTP 3',8-cyclase MoaA [Pigmentiphaga sp.]|nr:GTP 3',8-cyclase MoaA [Pigmentiphaga sp.]